MRQFMTTSVEQRKIFSGDFDTHPMETAWASEAIFFVKVDDVLEAESQVSGKVQISVDGVFWVDEGSSFEAKNKDEITFVRLSHFGGWLRILGNVDGTLKLTIHLVLKE